MLNGTENQLLEALEDLLNDVDSGGSREDASCHTGITTVDRCVQCQRVMRAREAVKEAKAKVEQ